MTRNIRLVVWALGGACLGAGSALALTGCDKTSANARPVAQEHLTAVVRVETVPVSHGHVQRVSEAMPAELMPYEKTDLYAKVSGFVKEMRVDYGDRVKKGNVLAVLCVPEMEKELDHKKALVARALAAIRQAQAAEKAAGAGVRSAEASLVEAEAGRTRARAQYERRKVQYANVEDLVNRKVIDTQTRDETLNQFKAAEAAVEEVEAKVKSARASLEETKAKEETARADVSAAEAQLLVAKADRDEVEALLQYTQILAPYEGVVTRRNLHTGAFINTGRNDLPLLSVMRSDRLRVIVDVPEKDVRYLKQGQTIQADLDALPCRKFTWKITRLAPLLGAGKKVRVEADIENGDGTLYPGMYGHAAVILEDKPGALTLPATCLVSDPKGSFVWVVTAGKAHRQGVTIGVNDGTKVEILSGLRGMEEVISGGKNALQEGQSIQAQGTAAGGKK
jgi:multidrug efflux pump subunit AcrA (membrane-fusion protein)